MKPEDTDKLVDAIDRNTEAIQRCGEDIDKFRSEVGSVGLWLFFIWIVLLSAVGCPRAKADPLLPPLGYEIGETPAPPPNPNMQYWYTMDVPGPDGVLPVEVFAPRLVAQVASEPQGVKTPEPGTGLIVLACLGVGRACQWYYRRKATKQIGNGDGFKVCCNKCLNRARKALEEK